MKTRLPRIPLNPPRYRMDLPSHLIGFRPPPCPVKLRFSLDGARCRLLVLTAAGRAVSAQQWLNAYGPASTQVAKGLSSNAVAATFTSVPQAWQPLLSSLVVKSLHLTPDGSACLFVEAAQDQVDRFIASLGTDAPLVRCRPAYGRDRSVTLTPRQWQALSLAVALGYYDVPHAVNQRAIAQKMGASVAAVSELLRRAESVIIAAYVDSLAQANQLSGDASFAEPGFVRSLESPPVRDHFSLAISSHPWERPGSSDVSP